MLLVYVLMNKYIKRKIKTIIPSPAINIWEKKIRSSPLAYRVFHGSFWSLLGAVVSKGFVLLTSIIIARLLGKTTYGQFGMIQSTVGMFGVFAGFGLGMTATKYISEYRNIDKVKVGKIVALSDVIAISSAFLISLVLFIFSNEIATSSLSASELSNTLKISSLLLFANAIVGIQIGILSGFESFKKIAQINVISALVSLPALTIGGFFFHLEGAVVGTIINSIVNISLNSLAIKNVLDQNSIKKNYKHCFDQISIIWKFSIPATLSSVLVAPVNWICYSMLVKMPNGYSEMALINAANQWRSAILFIPAILGSMILPILSNLYSEKSLYKFKKVLSINLFLNFIISTVITLTIIPLSGFIMESYGKDFLEGKIVLIIIVISTLINSSVSLLGQAIASMNKMWWGAALNMQWAIVLFITTYKYIDKGAKGLALANLFAYIVHLLLQAVIVFRILTNKKSKTN